MTEANCNNNSNALYGRRRGRKVGSGAGIKRKADDDYSQNPHTKRARARRARMGPNELAISMADAATRTAQTRAIKKMKTSENYQAMTEDERKIAIEFLKADIAEKRFVIIIALTMLSLRLILDREFDGYSKNTLEKIMKSRLDELIEKRQKDAAFTRKYLSKGYHEDEELFWDTDDEDAGESSALDPADGVPISAAADTQQEADLTSEIIQSLMESMGQVAKKPIKGESIDEEITDDLVTATKRTK